MKKLGRTKLEVIFKRVSPIGDIKTIDRDGVLTILKTLQITSAGKDSVLSDLGFFGKEGDNKIVLSIDEFEKMLIGVKDQNEDKPGQDEIKVTTPSTLVYAIRFTMVLLAAYVLYMMLILLLAVSK